MRLIDADDFFQRFPELAIEPYINAPTVECPQGEWVEKVETKQIGLYWLTTHEIVCSVCGGSGESDENVFQCWKFCPNCGAKMKGGAE